MESSMPLSALIEFEETKIKIELDDDEPKENLKVSRRRKSFQAIKSCAVCDAPTQYSHYGVPSCFACKIFFRRMVLSESKNKCKYTPKCDIFKGLVCQSCRFDKCLIIGMNPRVIQFPTTSKANEIVESLNKRKKFLEDQYFGIRMTKPKTEATTYCYEIDSLLYLESKIRKIRESSYNPTYFYSNIDEVLQHSCALAYAHKYEKPQHWPINMDIFGENYDYIAHELNTLSRRYKRNWLEIDLILILEAAKALPIYFQLGYKDKIRLLEKVSFINTKLLEYFYSAQKQIETLSYPDGFAPIKLYTKEPVCREATPMEYTCFCQNPNSIASANLNTTEYVLLKSMIYCYSAIPDISEEGRILLSKQREAYAQTLLRYLQINLGEERGANRYLEIISLIPRLFQIVESTRMMWMHAEMMRRTRFDFTDSISKLIDQVLMK